MRSLLVVLIVFGSVPLILVKPHIGVLVWSWISYMNPHRISWGIADDIPLAMVIGSATLLAWLFSRERKYFPITVVTGILLAFTLWTNVTMLFAVVPDDAFVKWERTMKILLMACVTMSLMGSRERLHSLVWVIVASIGFYGVRGGIFTILTGGNYRVWGPPGSFIADNNTIGLALTMILPLMRYLQLRTEHMWLRMGLYGVMGLTVVAIIGTYSRSSLIALGVVVVVLWLKSRRRMLLGAVLGITTIVAATLMPGKWTERMETIQNYSEDESVQGRFDAWSFAYQLAEDRPIVGGGFNVFQSLPLWERYVPNPVSYKRSAHSIYFEVLGEHGFIGLILFLLLGIATLRAGTWTLRRTRDRPDLQWARDLTAMTQTSVIAYAVAGLVVNIATFDLYYHLIGIIVLTKILVAKAIETPMETEPAEGTTDPPPRPVLPGGPSLQPPPA